MSLKHTGVFPTVDGKQPPAVRLPLSPRGRVVFYLNLVLVIVSTLTVTARVYIRRFVLKSFRADDWGSVVALISTIMYSALQMKICTFVTGHHMRDLPPGNIKKYSQILPASALASFTAGFLTRFAILLFLRRLVNELRWEWAIWFSAAFMTVQWLAYCLAFLLQCRPVYALWDRSKARYCFPAAGQRALVLSYYGFAVGYDLALWAAPIIIVVRRMVFTKMKLRLIAVFSVGAFAVVSALLKLIYSAQLDTKGDFLYDMYLSLIFHDLEPHVGIIVGCFPALHPLFRWVRKIIITSMPTSKGSRTGGVDHAFKVGMGPNTTGESSKSGGGEGTHHELYCMHGGRNTTDVRTGDSNDSQEMMVMEEGGGIYKHTEVEVTSGVGERSEERGDDDGSSLGRGSP